MKAIEEIISRRIEENKGLQHALLSEVAVMSGLTRKEALEVARELFREGKIKGGNTINDVYLKIN